MAVKHEAAVLALGQAIQGSQVYSAFLPSISTIRRASWASDDEHLKDIRDGEKVATIIVIGTGFVFATLMEDTAPIYAAIVISVSMLAVYEWALRTRPGNGEKPCEGCDDEALGLVASE